MIGGGFSGIAAAVSLRDLGASVTLLDDRATLGGRARSDDLEGFTIDTGAQLIASSFARTVGLISSSSSPSLSSSASASRRVSLTADSDARPQLRRVAGRDAYVRGDERFPLQFGSVRSLLAFGGLSAMEKLKLATHTLPVLTKHHSALDAAALDIPAALDAGTARAYMASHVGAQAADVLVEPPLNGFYGVRGNEASLAFYLMLGRYASEGDMLAPSAGWSRALDSALAGIACQRGVTARELRMTADDRMAVLASDARSWDADGVILATGPRSAAALIGPLLGDGDPLLHWLASLTLRPTWTLALAVDTVPRRDAFGIFHDARHARWVSACAVHGAKLRQPPADRDVVLAWPTPDAVSELMNDTPENIAAAMLPEVERLVPGLRGHVSRARVYRFDEGKIGRAHV